MSNKTSKRRRSGQRQTRRLRRHRGTPSVASVDVSIQTPRHFLGARSSQAEARVPITRRRQTHSKKLSPRLSWSRVQTSRKKTHTGKKRGRREREKIRSKIKYEVREVKDSPREELEPCAKHPPPPPGSQTRLWFDVCDDLRKRSRSKWKRKTCLEIGNVLFSFFFLYS